jgi:benzoyl-CoA reductase/2-hydroxyglutaryl-CoA dehydratase subunit BcrC/BadD/HgdB
MARRIGITTTVPHEIIVAGGDIPVDLNNLFIAAPQPGQMLDQAETEGFPPAVCSWIKGIYAGARVGNLDAVVTVLSGDCSNTEALAEVLRHRGIETIPFGFPRDPEPVAVRQALAEFADRFGATLAEAEAVRDEWTPLRHRLQELDRLAWEANRVTSNELHGWLLASSDFESDAADFDLRLTAFLDEAARREPLPAARRLALLGVPPIFSDLFTAIEERGARVVLCETPRQFAMIPPARDLVEQFCRYTYPYPLDHRIADIEIEMRRRQIDAAIHYVQAFCHRQIEQIVLRDRLAGPVLALEGDRPGPLSGQTITRLDAFLEMLG